MKVFYYLIFLLIGFSFATEKVAIKTWTPEIGISIGSPAPLFLSAGLHYQFSEKVGAFIRAAEVLLASLYLETIHSFSNLV